MTEQTGRSLWWTKGGLYWHASCLRRPRTDAILRRAGAHPTVRLGPQVVMLSELRRLQLVDALGARGRVVDFAIDPSAGDYPPVTRVFFKGARGQPMEVPWDAVVDTCWHPGRWRVESLATALAAPPNSLGRAVLLARDVLDALLLDVSQCQTMRANDLWLRDEGGQLRLRAADVSPWAVLRRLGHGLLGHGAEQRLVDWRNIEFLRGSAAAARAHDDYHARVQMLPPSAIARLADDLPYHHAAELLVVLPDPLAADTLEAMSPERQLQVFEDLDDETAVHLLALMAPDSAADLVGRLDPAWARRRLNSLPAAQATAIVDLLRFPEDTAGGIMTNDIPIVPIGLTIGETRSALRERLRTPDFIYYIYVVDAPDSRPRRNHHVT